MFSCQLAVAAEHLLSQWVEGKQRRKIHNQCELFSSQRQTVYSNSATVSNHKVGLNLATGRRGGVLGHTATTVSEFHSFTLIKQTFEDNNMEQCAQEKDANMGQYLCNKLLS